VSELLSWELSGTYLESCNCEAICPCRRIGGRDGGRSTYGICMFALSWAIERGHARGVDLSGLGVLLAGRYDDDEPGSPWLYRLYVDDGADAEQRDALAGIFTGRLGGTPERQFPWVWKRSDLLGITAIPMEIQHVPKRGWFRGGESVSLRISGPVEDQEPVTCVIPGHHRDGTELYAELLEVRDPPLEFEFSRKCAYESTFEYSSEDR
jgi:hypothetical protein